MAQAKADKQALWVEWTHDAIGRYEAPDSKDIKDVDDLVDDMVGVATAYADSMLDAFEERFEPSTTRARRKKKKVVEEDEDEDEDED